MRTTRVRTITVPELYCPFPSQISDHVEAVGRHTFEWALSHGLLPDQRSRERFSAGRYGALAARNHPHADPDLLVIVANWYAWLFLFDDRGANTSMGTSAERLKRVTSRFEEILRHGADGPMDEPFEESLRDFAERVASRGGPRWMSRFVESCVAYFDSLAWEADNRAARRTPDAAAYAKMRLHIGAVETSFIVGELAEGMDVPAQVLEHPAVMALREAANKLVCWQNDLLSLSKELDIGEVHNLVVVTQQRDGGSLQEAVDAVAAQHDAEMQRFVEMSENLQLFGDEAQQQLDGLVTILRHWVRGNLDWSQETGRYLVSAGGDDLLRSHRREIAVVRCNLRGIASLSELAEPEDVMEVLRQFHDAIGASTHEFGATVGSVAADGIMVFFNDPLPCPVPVERALSMAVALRDGLAGITREWRRRGHDVGFGMGIAYGYATLGEIGFEGRYDYRAIGSVVNLADRLCDQARHGQILISKRAHTAVEEMADSEEVAQLTLEGVHGPVTAFTVVGLRPARSAPDTAALATLSHGGPGA